MPDKFTFRSAGEIQEVEFALARSGWTHSLLKKATQGDFFGLIRAVLEGRADICRIERLTESTTVVMTQHLINCDAPPFIPDGWRVEEANQLMNRVRGVFEWDPNKVKLHLSPNQMSGKFIKGEQLQTELANESVLSANVMDYLLAHPTLIPDEWKGKYVFFWGTVYRDSDGDLCVRSLYFGGGGWRSGYDWLGFDWRGDYPAAVRAS